MPLEYANSELVARAYVKSLGITGCNTTLPQNPANWGGDTFVVLSVTGANIHPEFRLRMPVITAECFATKLANPKPDGVTTQSPDWAKACDLAEKIVMGCYDDFVPVDIALGVTGAPAARIYNVGLIGEPRRVPDDQSGYAKYTVDFQIKWAQLTN
ncbi:hypothetical protein ACFUN8_18540 [Streptomyces sp. NPDC057307]|uniref:hypothetical protein n=1 Tax=Streptomyces sp. NPDC057307 TaxID=3346096 RepID=UPI00362AC3A5